MFNNSTEQPRHIITVFSIFVLLIFSLLTVSCGGGGGGSISFFNEVDGGTVASQGSKTSEESGSKISITSDQLFAGETAAMINTTAYEFIKLKVEINGVETVYQIQKGQDMELNLKTALGDKLQMQAEICDAAGNVVRTATSNPITIGLGKNEVVMYISYTAKLHHADGTVTKYPFTSLGATLPVDTTTYPVFGYVFNAWGTECTGGSYDGTNAAGTFTNSIAPETRSDIDLYAYWTPAPAGGPLTMQIAMSSTGTNITQASGTTYRYNISKTTSSIGVSVSHQTELETAIKERLGAGTVITYEYTSSNSDFSITASGANATVTTSGGKTGTTTITCQCKADGVNIANTTQSYTLKAYNPGTVSILLNKTSGGSTVSVGTAETYAIGDSRTYSFVAKNSSGLTLSDSKATWTVSITADASSGTSANSVTFNGSVASNKTLASLGLKDTYTGTMTVSLSYAVPGESPCTATKTVTITGCTVTEPTIFSNITKGTPSTGNTIKHPGQFNYVEIGFSVDELTDAEYHWTFTSSKDSTELTRTTRETSITSSNLNISYSDIANINVSFYYLYHGKKSEIKSNFYSVVPNDSLIITSSNISEISSYDGISLGTVPIILSGTFTESQTQDIGAAIKSNSSKSFKLDFSGATVTKIKDCAFEDCTNLVDVNLAGVEIISYGAFRNTGLTNLVIPEGCKKLLNECFTDCSQLTEVTLPDSLEFISNYTFKMSTGTYANNILTKITMPSKTWYSGSTPHQTGTPQDNAYWLAKNAGWSGFWVSWSTSPSP